MDGGSGEKLACRDISPGAGSWVNVYLDRYWDIYRAGVWTSLRSDLQAYGGFTKVLIKRIDVIMTSRRIVCQSAAPCLLRPLNLMS